MSDDLLATVSLRLRIPGVRADALVGRDDDDSPEWIEELESAIATNLSDLIECIHHDPEVEVL